MENVEKQEQLIAHLLGTLVQALSSCQLEVVIDPARGNPMNHRPFGTLVRMFERLLEREAQAEAIGNVLGRLPLDDQRATILGVALGGSYTGFGLPQRLRRAPHRVPFLEPLRANLIRLGTPDARRTATLIARITGVKDPASRKGEGLPKVLPITLEGALDFARTRGVSEKLGVFRQANFAAPSTTPMPKDLMRLYGHFCSMREVLAPIEELPQLRERFAALVASHVVEGGQKRGAHSSDLRSYLPATLCIPFGVGDEGDIFFLSERARDPESGSFVVLRLVHDEACKVRPWARTVGELVAVAALQAWARDTFRDDEVIRWLWRRRIR